MMTIIQRIGLFFIACGLSGTLGFVMGVRNRKAVAPRVEPPAAAIRYEGGALTLARVNTPPPAPLPMPPGAAARTRAAVVELAPSEKPTEIQIDTVKMKDGTQRVTVQGPGIIGGADFPIDPGPALPVRKWTLAAGMGYKSYSVLGLWSRGPVEIGGMVHLNRVDRPSWDAQVMVGIRF